MFINFALLSHHGHSAHITRATSSLHPAHSFRRFYSATVWGRCHPTDSSDVCGSIIVVIFTIGVTAKLMGSRQIWRQQAT